MQVFIFGCDRMVTMLVPELVQAGHRVGVIDHRSDFLDMVADLPGVETILVAEPLLQDYLRQGGIDNADLFLALSEDDHQNALVAQIAHHIFHVPKVVCRLENPQLQELYSRLGLTVLGPTAGLLQGIRQALEG